MTEATRRGVFGFLGALFAAPAIAKAGIPTGGVVSPPKAPAFIGETPSETLMKPEQFAKMANELCSFISGDDAICNCAMCRSEMGERID